MAGQDCIFCRIAAGELDSERIYEDGDTVAFMDINPATRGHALVIPRRHSRNLYEISDEDLGACMRTAKLIAGRARDRLEADGINIINSCEAAAWQTVFHFHVHVIPRYDDDPLRLPWRPSPGDSGEIRAAAEALRE